MSGQCLSMCQNPLRSRYGTVSLDRQIDILSNSCGQKQKTNKEAVQCIMTLNVTGKMSKRFFPAVDVQVEEQTQHSLVWGIKANQNIVQLCILVR